MDMEMLNLIQYYTYSLLSVATLNLVFQDSQIEQSPKENSHCHVII